MIFNNKKRLDKWREDRHINECPSYETYVRNILEELLEPMYRKEEIHYMVDCIVDVYFTRDVELNDNDILDAISDIRVFSINQTELMGYDSDECLSETIDEISSRRQCPLQEKEWKENGYNGEKWRKNPKQNKDTLYTADYRKCKRVPK
jgi:hypothetical protein